MKKIEIGMEKEITELMPAAKKGTGPGFWSAGAALAAR
jgi:hypothetical protein